MTVEQPMLTEQEIEEWKKIKSRYSTLIRGGSDLSTADKKIVEQGLKYRLYIMTFKDQLRELHDRRLDLIATDLPQAGRLISKGDQVEPFRRYIMEQIVRLTEPLLQNNFYVRLQAATLLGELDLVMADTQRNLRHKSYIPACEPLIKVLRDPEQHIAVKIAAARSLLRLLRHGEAPVELRHRIADTVLAELADKNTYFWYQMRLAEVLSTLDVSLDLQNRKPFVVSGLLSVLRDPQRDLRVRAEAARSLGRVPIDAQVDVAALMRDLMAFAADLATAAQQSPQDPKWKSCFWNLYFAFRPQDPTERDATGKLPAGLLNNPQAASAAQQGYKLVVPMVNAVINDKAINAADTKALQDWLQQNAPAPTQPVGGGPATSTASPALTNN